MDVNREILTLCLDSLYLLIVFLLMLFNKYMGKHSVIFIAAMVVTAFVEWFGYFRVYILGTNNNSGQLYNFGIVIIFYSIIHLYFYRLLETPKLRRIQMVIIGVNLLNYLLSMLFDKDYFTTFPFYTNLVSSILLLVSVSLFLYETFNSEKILSLKTYFPFWAAVSLLTIYLALIPLMLMSSSDLGAKIDRNIFLILLFSVNFIGYSLMLFGILLVNYHSKKSIKFESQRT